MCVRRKMNGKGIVLKKYKKIQVLRLTKGLIEGVTPLALDFDEILKIVSAVSKVGEKDILKRRSEHSLERKMLMYCGDKYCRSRMSLSNIAGKMSVSQSGLARSKGRFETELAGNKSLRRRLDEIENMLSQ